MNKNYLLLKKKTIRNREKIRRLYFDPMVKQFGGIIKPIEAFEILQNKKLAPTTINITMYYIKTMANENNIYYDPIEMAKVLKFTQKKAKGIRRKALTEEEAKELMEVTRKQFPNYYPEILFGLHTGARLDEMHGLEWRDLVRIDKKYYILIRRSYGEETTKNGIAKKIPASRDLKNAIDKIFNKYYTKHKKIPSKYDKVFKRRKIGSIFPKIRKCLSFDKPVSFHVLRHTFATILLNKNVIPKDVQQLMGHSSVATTLDMYWTRPLDMDLDGYLPSIVKRRTNGQKETTERRVEQTIENDTEHPL